MRRRTQHCDPQITTERRSGARLFAITAEVIDLTPQLLDPLMITAGDRHGESEFQLFELMAAFGKTAVLASR
jgi:hypothetical protein